MKIRPIITNSQKTSSFKSDLWIQERFNRLENNMNENFEKLKLITIKADLCLAYLIRQGLPFNSISDERYGEVRKELQNIKGTRF